MGPDRFFDQDPIVRKEEDYIVVSIMHNHLTYYYTIFPTGILIKTRID